MNGQRRHENRAWNAVASTRLQHIERADLVNRLWLACWNRECNAAPAATDLWTFNPVDGAVSILHC